MWRPESAAMLDGLRLLGSIGGDGQMGQQSDVATRHPANIVGLLTGNEQQRVGG